MRAGQILCEPVYYISAYAPFLMVLIIPLYFYLIGNKQQAGLSVIAFFLTLGISESLKIIFNIPRPFNLGRTNSFPSSHTSLAFCEARFMNVNKTVFVFGLLFAVFIGLGRIYTGFHTWYDVVAGSFLGYFVGEVVIKTFTKYSRVIFHKK